MAIPEREKEILADTNDNHFAAGWHSGYFRRLQ